MTHPYTPNTGTAPRPAAALVLDLQRPNAPAWLGGLVQRAPVIVGQKLVPVVAVDFYPPRQRG